MIVNHAKNGEVVHGAKRMRASDCVCVLHSVKRMRVSNNSG
jgi:hypothetical protein